MCCLLCLQDVTGLSVPLSAAAKGMTRFVTVAADQQGVCSPSSNTHPSYVALKHFLQHLSQVGTWLSWQLHMASS